MVTIALRKLEEKIDEVIENMEWLHLQIEELEQNQVHLKNDNAQLKEQKMEWEQTLAGLLNKLEKLQPSAHKVPAAEEAVY